jgi:hypothetical protein
LTRKPSTFERDLAFAERRRAELLTELRAGVDPASPAYVWTYGERQPERDCFGVGLRWRDRERTDVELAADHWPFDLEQKFRVMYGAHDPRCWWAYQVPAGAVVTTDEPEGWQGWRAGSVRPWPPTGAEREDFDRSTTEALG